MTKLEKLSLPLEKLFWVFLFINPFLDIINGLYINLIMQVDILDIKFVSTLGVTPSLIVRMVMLVIFACYVLVVRDKKSILTALPIGAAWILSIVSEYLNFGSAQYFLDTQYTARFCFNIVLLMVYTRVFAARWGEDCSELLRRLDTIVCFTITVLNEIGIFLDMLHKTVSVLAHFEEVSLLTRLLNGTVAVGALAVDYLSLGKEGLAGSAVPALVVTLVDVALLVEFIEYLSDRLFMVIVGRADKVVVRRTHLIPDVLYLTGDAVNVFFWSDACLFGKIFYLLTVLVSTRAEEYVVAASLFVARDCVGHDDLVGVSEVRLR